jgi:hypothetical protein
MDTGTIVLIIVAVLVVAAAAMLLTLRARRRRRTAASGMGLPSLGALSAEGLDQKTSGSDPGQAEQRGRDSADSPKHPAN